LRRRCRGSGGGSGDSGGGGDNEAEPIPVPSFVIPSRFNFILYSKDLLHIHPYIMILYCIMGRDMNIYI
jgi:hypothetical protein